MPMLADRMNYRNLDEEPSLKGLNTTTEVLARLIFDRIGAAIRRDELGPGGRAVSPSASLFTSHTSRQRPSKGVSQGNRWKTSSSWLESMT